MRHKVTWAGGGRRTAVLRPQTGTDGRPRESWEGGVCPPRKEAQNCCPLQKEPAPPTPRPWAPRTETVHLTAGANRGPCARQPEPATPASARGGWLAALNPALSVGYSSHRAAPQEPDLGAERGFLVALWAGREAPCYAEASRARETGPTTNRTGEDGPLPSRPGRGLPGETDSASEQLPPRGERAPQPRHEASPCSPPPRAASSLLHVGVRQVLAVDDHVRVVRGLEGEAAVADAAAVALLLVDLHDVLQVLLPPAEGQLPTGTPITPRSPHQQPPGPQLPRPRRALRCPGWTERDASKCGVRRGAGGGRPPTCPPDRHPLGLSAPHPADLHPPALTAPHQVPRAQSCLVCGHQSLTQGPALTRPAVANV